MHASSASKNVNNGGLAKFGSRVPLPFTSKTTPGSKRNLLNEDDYPMLNSEDFYGDGRGIDERQNASNSWLQQM